MCGLYGVYSQDMTTNHHHIFKKLAMLSLPRGMDATGVAVVRSATKKEGKKKVKEYSTWWYKSLGNAGLFYLRDRALEVAEDPTNIVLMGHNRAATIGDADKSDGAHPFEHGDILGSHNGTIRDHKFKPDEDFVSDSDKLFFMINELGLEKAAQQIRSGVFAVSFIDRKTGTFNLVKNTLLRDVFIMWSEDKTTLLWASEEDFLLRAVLEHKDWGWDDPFELPIDTLFTIDYKKNEYEQGAVDLQVPFVSGSSNNAVNYKKKKKKKQKGRSNHVPSVSALPNGNQHNTQKLIDKKSDTIILSHKHHPMITFFRHEVKCEKFVEYSNGMAIPIKSYERLLKNGCGMCGEGAQIDEHVIWLDAGTFLHHQCFDDPAYQSMTN